MKKKEKPAKPMAAPYGSQEMYGGNMSYTGGGHMGGEYAQANSGSGGM